ncbi:hypothetical protein G3I60_31380 [Streptomyces sp. SID13666]|uniref:hypothetical protein n=1 Tax=unclassified Streptomyces TaxID=2593676 RepID=UPI0013C07E3C|nr:MULTISPECIES: hypothetical protein [unclassified Streptomyces]NEA58532.1 hypothetical protein [Streptomyces sp. SID13666]NEA72480.1 hypothetical protein [Streptomyces sp. SID13588]
MSTQREQREYSSEIWKDAADRLNAIVSELLTLSETAPWRAKQLEVVPEDFMAPLDRATEEYLEHSHELGLVLASGRQERAEEDGAYDADEALLGVAATDIAFAQALAEVFDEESADVVSKSPFLSTFASADHDGTTALQLRIFEAYHAVRGNTAMGASAPEGDGTVNAFVEDTVKGLLDESGKKISGTLLRVVAPVAVGDAVSALMQAIPQGLASAVSRVAAEFSGVLAPIRRKILLLVGEGLEKLSSVLGSGSDVGIGRLCDWIKGQWGELSDDIIAARALGVLLGGQNVLQAGCGTLVGASPNQITAAEESLQQLQKLHRRRLQIVGTINIGLGVTSLAIPGPAQVFVLVGAVLLVFSTTYMCGDALDSPIMDGFPQCTEGVIRRIKAATT